MWGRGAGAPGRERFPGRPEGHRAPNRSRFTLESTEPIAFRRQNFGDCEIPSLDLKEGLEPAGRTGFGLRVRG